MSLIAQYTASCDRCGRQRTVNENQLPAGWRQVQIPNPEDPTIQVMVDLHPGCVRDLAEFRQNLEVAARDPETG